MGVVVNDNLSWRMLFIVSPGLTFRTALPRVTIIATPLVVLLQFLLRTRRAHISRKGKGSPFSRMNPSPKIMQLMSNRNVTPYHSPPLLFPYPSHTINTLGSVGGLVPSVSMCAHIFGRFLSVEIVGIPLFLLLFHLHPIAPDTASQPRVQ